MQLVKACVALLRRVSNESNENEMPKPLAKLYRQTRIAISQTLPNDWQTAWVLIEMEENTGSLICYYRSEIGSIKPLMSGLSLDSYSAFRRLRHEISRVSTTPKWSSATYILQRNGAFSIEYGYEPVPIEDENERLQAWKQRHGL